MKALSLTLCPKIGSKPTKNLVLSHCHIPYQKTKYLSSSATPPAAPSRVLINSLIFTFSFIFIISLIPTTTSGEFAPSFVWSAVNKYLDEDRLNVVDGNNDRIKIKNCTKLVLYNEGSSQYAQQNLTGEAILIDTTKQNFATQNVIDEIKSGVNKKNPGKCLPCIVVISIVNLTMSKEENDYRNADMNKPERDKWEKKEELYQDFRLSLSLQFVKLLQFKTPIQSRYLIIVRLVEKNKDLTVYHGNKYTTYPRRLVPLWEQVLFEHFKEARVLQGATADGNSQTTLAAGKENGIWVWMCEEIVRRLQLQDKCEEHLNDVNELSKLNCTKHNNELSTGSIPLTNMTQCRTYRPRTQ